MVATNEEPNDPHNLPAVISVLHHDAFAAKHIPSLGHTIKETKVFHWKVQDWKKLEKKLTSPEFSCGGHKWRILLFPFGLPEAPSNDTVSVYLDHADSNLSEGWHVCAQFALVISNPYYPTYYTVSHAHHRFIAEERDWGFTRFSELRNLYESQPGQGRPTIEDDSAVVSVYVRTLEDPTGVLWHNFVNYDSKKETGYVGLKNQGATGYMNAVLQSLFCMNHFRKIIYQIPTEGQLPTASVPLAIQRIFFNLQTSEKPVGTTDLTKSFGWKSLDSFLQHDVQEFNRVLQDKLESLMKGTRVEGTIPKLFVGKMKTSIKCVNVDYESCRVEEFNDIELNVKGMRTLYDSFRDYIAIETLDGELKYQAEGFGPQDARKGIIFQSFPPVLYLSLKRWEYDIRRDAMVKLDDRFEFPFEIDLGDFLDKTADKTKPWKYKLHSVFVHSGGLYGGQYSVIIKPDRHTRWLKFDDDRVIPVVDREVFEDNYGGEPLGGRTQGDQVKATDKSTNARMLVYIRETAADEVLVPIAQGDIPPHLKRGLDEERAQIEAKKKEREEQHLFLTAKVITDETFSRHEGFDLAAFDERNWPSSDLPEFRVLKTTTYSAFKSMVAKHFSYPESRIRLWVLVNRQNKTVRPDTHIPENEPSLTVDVIRSNMAVRQQSDLRLYLDILPDLSKGIKSNTKGTVMIFLKHFDTAKQTLFGIGKIYMQSTSKVADLVPVINERMKWAPGPSMKLYEEIKPGMVELPKPNLTFTQSDIQDGDIICFQRDLADAELYDLKSQGLYLDPPQFYGFLQNRVMVLFRPKFEEPDDDQPEFSLVLSKTHNYDAMAGRVGERLKHNSIKLRFTTTHAGNGQAKAILKRAMNQSIAEIVNPSYIISPAVIILYEKLEVSIVDLETKRSLRVTWTGLHNNQRSMYPFLLPKTGMVHDLVVNLSKMVQLTPGGTGRIRVFELAKDGKTKNEFTGTEMIGNLPDPVDLFAEEVPRE